MAAPSNSCIADLSLSVADEAAMQQLGRQLAAALPADKVLLTLRGDLGVGKSVLARSLLQSCGVTGPIKSPTYTLLETYRGQQRSIAHLDLYRLADADELHYLGFDDVMQQQDLIVIEWPERAAQLLDKLAESIASVQIEMAYQPLLDDASSIAPPSSANLPFTAARQVRICSSFPMSL